MMQKISHTSTLSSRICLTLLLVVVFTAGCSPTSKRAEKILQSAVPLVWPTPPEIPRIAYTASINNPEDLQITPGLWERFWNYLTGRPDLKLVSPYGLAADNSERLYVADSFLKKVVLFDHENSKTSISPEDDGQLQSPIDIAIDDVNNRIFISDSSEGVVWIFSRNGSGNLISSGELGRKELDRPTGITINTTTSELLVVDTGSNSVFRFDLVTRNFLGRFGDTGTGTSQFNRPTGIGVDNDGRIIVTDALNCRIQIFSPEGHYINTFGSAGDGPGYFARPRGVAVDSDNNIYVVDALFDNVQIFNPQGRLLLAFGVPGTNPGQFWLPAGIHITPEDKIFVADSYNKRVQVFQYLKEGRQTP